MTPALNSKLKQLITVADQYLTGGYNQDRNRLDLLVHDREVQNWLRAKPEQDELRAQAGLAVTLLRKHYLATIPISGADEAHRMVVQNLDVLLSRKAE